MQPLDGTDSLVIDGSKVMSRDFKDEASPDSNAVRAAPASERAAVQARWPLEVANVLRMGRRRKSSNQAKAAKWLRLLSALPIAVDTETPGRAFDPILGPARVPELTAFDAAHLELATRLGVPLASRDDALEEAARAAGVPLFIPPGLS